MTANFLLLPCAALCAVIWVVWKYLRQIFIQSPLDNIPGPPPGSFFYGNLRQVVHKNGWAFIEHLTESYPGIVRLHGPLGHRMLYIFDPLAMHNVVVKDQYTFEEPVWLIKFNNIRFGPGLLATLGDRHRKQRKMLNPVFSIAHMRRMIPIFNQIGHKLQAAIEDRVRGHTTPIELDMLAWMSRTALELIGQAGLGYSFDPLVADVPDEFAQAIKNIGPAMVKINHLRRIIPYFPDGGSVETRRRIMGLIPHSGVQAVKTVINVMHSRSVEIHEEKKRALERGDDAVMKQVGEGKDIMSMLLRANMAASEGDRLPEDELIAQMSTFIAAGMDTTSNALSMILTLLAEHLDVQEKLRSEILKALDGKADLDHDVLVSLPYLDAVCRETLRLHAPVTNTFREARQDIMLPLSNPITGRDGSTIREIMVPKGTAIVIGCLSANRNKAIWGEDAMEWKPERWLAPLPASVTEAKIPGVYSNLMTFMGGGRACIGFKFSQLEMKVILTLLLSKFTVEPSGQPIIWNLSGVRFPTVGDNPKPSLPMKVGLYKGPTRV